MSTSSGQRRSSNSRRRRPVRMTRCLVQLVGAATQAEERDEEDWIRVVEISDDEEGNRMKIEIQRL